MSHWDPFYMALCHIQVKSLVKYYMLNIYDLVWLGFMAYQPL